MSEPTIKIGQQVRITIHLSADHTIQVWGKATGTKWDVETGAVQSIEISENARVFDVAEQRYL